MPSPAPTWSRDRPSTQSTTINPKHHAAVTHCEQLGPSYVE